EYVILRAGRVAGPHLGGLLTETRNPQCELALALQVPRLDVEAPHDHHLPVEVEQAALVEARDEGQVGSCRVALDERPLGREQLNRRLGIRHGLYPMPRSIPRKS